MTVPAPGRRRVHTPVGPSPTSAVAIGRW